MSAKPTQTLFSSILKLPPSVLRLPAACLLVPLCFLLFYQGIVTRSLWASHEARAAQNAQRMLDDGDWLLPRLYDGQVELQKPPGFYWLVAAVGSIRGGVDAVAVRLPAIVAAMLMVLMIWWHLHRRGRYVAAFVAGAMLAGAVHFTGTARIGRIDVPLACVVTAIVLCSRFSLPPQSKEGRARIAWIGLFGGAALLLKGPIGIVLPIAVLGLVCLIERGSIRHYAITAILAGAIALAFASPWYLWANGATDGEFFRTFFLYHHVNRAFGGAEALAGHPWWYYVPRFAADFLPWTPLLLIALVQRRWRGDADALFGLIWLVAMILVLSISRFKRADYLLPAYGGAAIFLGCALERWYLERSAIHQRRWRIAFFSVLIVLPIGWLIFDQIVTAKEEATRNQETFATRIREHVPYPHDIVMFRVESHLLGYHLGRPIHTLVEWGDLNVRLRNYGPHYIVTRAEFLDEVRTHALCVPEVLLRSEDVSSVRPHRPFILLHFHGLPCPTPLKD